MYIQESLGQTMEEESRIFLRGLHKYCQQTTLHGWQYIYTETGFFSKSIWIFVIIVSNILASVTLFYNWSMYMSANTTTFLTSTTASLDKAFNLLQIEKYEIRKNTTTSYFSSHRNFPFKVENYFFYKQTIESNIV